MKRFARRLSQAAAYPITRARRSASKSRAVLERPSLASIYCFDDDRTYINRLGLSREVYDNQPENHENQEIAEVVDSTSEGDTKETRFEDRHKAENYEQLARMVRFLSIMYALLLVIIGVMFTVINIERQENFARDVYIIACSMIGMGWLAFLHYDIRRYKRWVVAQVKERPSRFVDVDNDNRKESTSIGEGDFDRLSLTTAYIFDFFSKGKKTQADTSSTFEQRGYRFFLGKHSNDFYLKIGMIIFCFGNVTHMAMGLIQQFYYFTHAHSECQSLSKIAMNAVVFVFAFYQLFIAFKYSNIIINRHKNVARFALMHLIGTAISIWLDSITDEAIEDYVDRKLAEHSNTTLVELELITLEQNYQLREHLIHQHHCLELSFVSSSSMNAIPYLYPFAIEFNIALASVWLMLFFNIGNINHKALFKIPGRPGHEDEEDDEEDDQEREEKDEDLEAGYKRRVSVARGLSMNVDCHSSNRGLFLGLAILLVTIITLIVFFSTIQTKTYTHFGVFTYSSQIMILTMCCFVVIPFAYRQLRKLDTVHRDHQDNAFTMMDDILVLIPIPFYFVHHVTSAVASFWDQSSEYRLNNYLLASIDILTVLQVIIQSPFIVDGLRRCSTRREVRLQKPGRELVTLLLILNVTLWLLNTFELKSVEVFHASHHYFGEFAWMIISHSTLPLMLFYRFHSSVCLSNIWKYAYEKDD